MNDETLRESQLLKLRQAIRCHPALWGEMGIHKESQCEQILKKCSQRLQPLFIKRKENRQWEYGNRLMHLYT